MFLPGFLLPSDIRRIALHLGYSNPVEFALDNLLASPGAIVVDRGHIRRIRTLAPARRQDGACLFWTRNIDAGSTACLRTAAATSTRTKPKRRRIFAAARAITRLTWHGKMIISTRDSGCQCSSQFPFTDDRFAFTFDAYFAAKHIPSQIALK